MFGGTKGTPHVFLLGGRGRPLQDTPRYVLAMNPNLGTLWWAIISARVCVCVAHSNIVAKFTKPHLCLPAPAAFWSQPFCVFPTVQALAFRAWTSRLREYQGGPIHIMHHHAMPGLGLRSQERDTIGLGSAKIGATPEQWIDPRGKADPLAEVVANLKRLPKGHEGSAQITIA